MRLLMTSVVALCGIAIGASAATACEWHQQVMASTAAPATATAQPHAAPATQVDPAMIAYRDQLAKDASAVPATSQDAQDK